MKVIKEDMDQSLKEESLEDQEDLDPEDGEKEETAEIEVSQDLEDTAPKIGGTKSLERTIISVKSSSPKIRKM